MKLIAIFFVATIFSTQLYSLTLKVGLIAPDGTKWSKSLKKMAKEIKEKTHKKVKFKFYFGGSQGDEPDVLRKIRIGQLHGGIFTGKTLGDINGDVRVMELPFTFYDDQNKGWKTLMKLAPSFNSVFLEKQFLNLGFLGIGKVYFVSKKRSTGFRDLKGQKIWSWEGDPLVQAMIESMNLVSVPLSLPDVLSSLSTGIVEAAYAPPLGIVSLQWNSKVNYLIDFPLSFSIGAFLIDNKKWSQISNKNQVIVMRIAKKYIANLNESSVEDNKEAMVAMKNGGIEFLKFSKKDIEEGRKIRHKVIQKLKGKLFSEKILGILESEL